MPEEIIYDTIIIGGGAAGLGAALYAGRLEMKALVLAEATGGVIINSGEVDNYPGIENIPGFDLAQRLENHARKYKAEFFSGRACQILKAGDNFKVNLVEQGFLSKTVIIATGTEWRKLGVPGEKEYSGKGVHYCALCDGAFYKNKAVAVVGGSDSAVKDALLLTEYAKKVYIIYRKEDVRAEPFTKKKMENNPKIELITDTNVVEIRGDKFVNKLIIDKDYNGSMEFPIEGVFIDIGHIPLTDLVKDIGVKLNEKGEIIINRKGCTNIKGIFAAGDVTDVRFKQVITSVAEGVTAANNAYEFVNNVKCEY